VEYHHGHGIHAGIHFRSSSLYSILLGEQVGLAVLQDRARGYNEPFTIHITKFDGPRPPSAISNSRDGQHPPCRQSKANRVGIFWSRRSLPFLETFTAKRVGNTFMPFKSNCR